MPIFMPRQTRAAEQQARPVPAHQVLWRQMKRLDKRSQLRLAYMIHICQTAVQTLNSQHDDIETLETGFCSPFSSLLYAEQIKASLVFICPYVGSWSCLFLTLQRDHTTSVSSLNYLNMRMS